MVIEKINKVLCNQYPIKLYSLYCLLLPDRLWQYLYIQNLKIICVLSKKWLTIKNVNYMYYRVYTVPRPGRCGQSPLAGFHWPALFTVIPLREQTLQAGQNERALCLHTVQHFARYTWKSSIHCRGRLGFLCTHTKKVVSPCQTHLQSWIPQLWRSTKGGSDPASGAGDLRLQVGQKGESDPACGVRPCNRGIV